MSEYYLGLYEKSMPNLLSMCLSGHIAAMHLKETLPGKFREIPYGTGHVDFVNGIK